MLALDVFEGDEERLCLLGRQAILAETIYERALLRDVLGTFLNVPPHHLKFGFVCVHPGSIPEVPVLGSTRVLPPRCGRYDFAQISRFRPPHQPPPDPAHQDMDAVVI